MELKFLTPLVLALLTLSGIKGNAQPLTADSACYQQGCCCGGNDLTPAGIMISHVHPKKEWMISYRFMDMNMQGVGEGNKARSEMEVLATYTATPDLMQMRMHMLMVMYGLTDKLTLMAMVNYNSNYMEMTMPVGKNFHHHGMSSAGIGDTKLYGLYALKKEAAIQLILSMGINLPTGTIDAKGEAGAMMFPGTRLPYSMQLGSGTTDFLPGISYLYQWQKFTFSSQLVSVIRASKNHVGYKLGNELSANVWAGWKWLPFVSSTVRCEGNLVASINGKDKTVDPMMEPSANPANYGGKRINVFIGTSFQATRSFLNSTRLSIEYGVPVYQQFYGIQMKTSGILNVAVSTAF